jgi:hypothetical protein
MERDKIYQTRKSHRSRRRKPSKTRPPAPARTGDPGLQITSHRGVIRLKANLELSQRVLWILLFLSLLAALLLTSSLDDRLRSAAVEFLIGMLQLLIVKGHTPKP